MENNLIHTHPLNHVRFRALPCTLRGSGHCPAPCVVQGSPSPIKREGRYDWYFHCLRVKFPQWKIRYRKGR